MLQPLFCDVVVVACNLDPARVSTDCNAISHGTASVPCLQCYTLAVASITGIPAWPDTNNAPLLNLTLSIHTYLMPIFQPLCCKPRVASQGNSRVAVEGRSSDASYSFACLYFERVIVALSRSPLTRQLSVTVVYNR